MNCNNIRKYFYAFIDNELDVERNIDVLAHLDTCFRCSHRIEKERSLQVLVKETVCEVKAPDYLAKNILSITEEKPNNLIIFLKNLMSARRLIPLAGIAAAAVMMVYFFVIQGDLKKEDAAIYLAESRHHEYLMQQLDLDIRSQNPETVVEYLQKQTNSSVVLPDVKEEVQLIGAVVSEVDGIKVSQVFYMYEEKPVSVTIYCNADSQSGLRKGIDFSEMQKKTINKKVVYFNDKGHCGKCRIMGWNESEIQYVVVSRLHRDKMMKMFEKA